MGSVKAAYTRTEKSLSKQLAALEALFSRKDTNPDDWPEATAKMTAELVQKLRGQAELALNDIEVAGKALTNVILELNQEDCTEDLEDMSNKVEEDIADYHMK